MATDKPYTVLRVHPIWKDFFLSFSPCSNPRILPPSCLPDFLAALFCLCHFCPPILLSFSPPRRIVFSSCCSLFISLVSSPCCNALTRSPSRPHPPFFHPLAISDSYRIVLCLCAALPPRFPPPHPLFRRLVPFSSHFLATSSPCLLAEEIPLSDGTISASSWLSFCREWLLRTSF